MTTKQVNAFAESFVKGNCTHAGDFLGARQTAGGVLFRVWAPNAAAVAVTGDFCDWNPEKHPMKRLNGGIWELALPNISLGSTYKYAIRAQDGQLLWKADPYALYAQLRPETASRFYSLDGYDWGDKDWLSHRRTHKVYDSPLNIYELHPGSWRRNADGSFLGYGELAKALIPYVKKLGFTHIELMPVTEYPYDASWGYQCTGYFAATARYGTPHELMGFIDACHKSGIGVIMDWVPAHFPKDPHGLVEFDGSRLYEVNDPLMAEHPSWGTRIFDYGRGEVQSFLISSALFWLEKYHVDGLRVDAVASMLYLDYDRKKGKWRPNRYGGRENLAAVEFLRKLNAACFSHDDSILMIAEESTAWPLVTAPADAGGLGFNLKWNMGWMNDSLHYLKTDPYFRAGSHNDLTFSLMYAFSENFVLPLSHDEVVHMKGSLLNKVPGTMEQKFSTVRAFWAYMLAHPGKKLLFMGAELGQMSEWDFATALPWELLEQHESAALNAFFTASNRFYRRTRPLWELDFSGEGFCWLCPDESQRNLIGFMRRDRSGRELIFVCNFSGVAAQGFRIGLPWPGSYRLLFSSDETRFGGSGGLAVGSIIKTEKIPQHNLQQSIQLDIPPLTAVFFEKTGSNPPQARASAAKALTPNVSH